MSISVSQLELTKAIPTLTPTTVEPPELVIRPRRGWIAIDWQELWSHRELLYFLVWRDVKVRYKQAVLGIAWAVLAPVLSVLVFTLIFGRRGLGTNTALPEHLTTSLFIFAGLIPWMFLSNSITTGGMALVNQQNLLSKIYMPRLFIPASTIGSGLVDLCISFGVFFAWMMFTGYKPSGNIIFLPVAVLLTMLLSLGLAFSLSAMTVTYRDLRFLIPFITQIGMWMSAVVYPYKSVFPEHSKMWWLQLFNPFYGIIDSYRSALFGGWGWQPWHLLSSVIWTIGILIFGLFYFRKTERRFADIA